MHFKKLLEACGGDLSAGFAVAMPHNGIGSRAISSTHHERLYRNWKHNLEEICEYVSLQKTGRLESSILCFDLLKPGPIRMMPGVIEFVLRVLFRGVNSLGLTASKECNGCGICTNICPVDNIEVVENKPLWRDHCVICFACLHWCPKGAVSLGGSNMNIGIYHHPDVSLSDMLSQKPVGS